jgi:hypothetical protein
MLTENGNKKRPFTHDSSVAVAPSSLPWGLGAYNWRVSGCGATHLSPNASDNAYIPLGGFTYRMKTKPHAASSSDTCKLLSEMPEPTNYKVRAEIMITYQV